MNVLGIAARVLGGLWLPRKSMAAFVFFQLAGSNPGFLLRAFGGVQQKLANGLLFRRHQADPPSREIWPQALRDSMRKAAKNA
ncbi:MAG: hypothetical protein Q8M31_21720 [Beijerinckiaceae bacterium]|nr:hypothetical protein [Beijerinckiaceae bacterium]